MNKHQDIAADAGGIRATERGMSLIELMTSLAISMVIVSAAMMIVIAAVKSGRGSQDLSDLQRGGRIALSVLADEIGKAGLGLPRRLAFASGSATGLKVASVDLIREWKVAGSSAGAITLAALSDVTPPLNPTGAADTGLRLGQWLFLFKSATIDTSTAGSNHGHGMVQLTAARAANTTALQVATTSNFSTLQPDFNLAQTWGAGHDLSLMRAHVVEFALNTSLTDHPYMTITEDGSNPVPVVTDVDGVGGLKFAYFIDANCDGQSDDLNADGVIDENDTVTSPFVVRLAPCDPADNTDVMVTAVRVTVVLRSSSVDPGRGDYRRASFSQTIPTRNINTRATQFIFVDNTGI